MCPTMGSPAQSRASGSAGGDGERLKSWLDEGPVVVRLEVDARRASITSFNIVGELPGADDEAVIVGSHHDGPWASAVEDASGIALVLAQAAYWSRVPPAERPHRLMFLLNGGHMSGGAGQAAFVRSHRAELDHVVLEVHLEHAATKCRKWAASCVRPDGRKYVGGSRRESRAWRLRCEKQSRLKTCDVHTSCRQRLSVRSRQRMRRTSTPQGSLALATWWRRSICSTRWIHWTRSIDQAWSPLRVPPSVSSTRPLASRLRRCAQVKLGR